MTNLKLDEDFSTDILVNGMRSISPAELAYVSGGGDGGGEDTGDGGDDTPKATFEVAEGYSLFFDLDGDGSFETYGGKEFTGDDVNEDGMPDELADLAASGRAKIVEDLTA